MVWYKKVHKGTKAQYLFQAGVAINVLLLVVILPSSIDYIMVREGKKYNGDVGRGKVIKDYRSEERQRSQKSEEF